MKALFVLEFITCLILVWQDWSSRTVSVFWMLILSCTGCLIFLFQPNWQMHLQFLLMNVMYFALVLLMLIVYFSLRNRKLVFPLGRQLAWGDVWMILILAFFYDPLNYVSIITISSIVGILLVFFYRHGTVNRKSIPFVSALGITHIAFQIIAFIFQIPHL